MGTEDPIIMQTTRARSMPYRGVFYVATFWTLLHVFFVLGTAVTVVVFLLHHDKKSSGHFHLICVMCGIFLSLITLVISFYKRRKARCPLCRGTPLMNSGARAHAKSIAVPPFNHGFTAVLSIAFTQKLCCMYCGTRYDLLKKSHQRNSHGTYPEDPVSHHQ